MLSRLHSMLKERAPFPRCTTGVARFSLIAAICREHAKSSLPRWIKQAFDGYHGSRRCPWLQRIRRCRFERGRLPEALRWYRMAEDEQRKAGGSWVTGIDKSRERTEESLLYCSEAKSARKAGQSGSVLLPCGALPRCGEACATPRGTPLPQDKAERLATTLVV